MVQRGDSIESEIEILMTLLRDVLILGVSPTHEARLVNVDVVEQLRDLAAPLEAKAGATLDALETTLEGIRHKGNRQLLIENFLMALLPAAASSGPRAPTPVLG